MCVFCTGVEHARLAVSNPQVCPHCAEMPQKLLDRRLNVATGNNRGPNQGVSPRPFWADEVESEYPLEDEPSVDYPRSQGTEEDQGAMECDDLYLTGDTDEEGDQTLLLHSRPPSSSDRTGPADTNFFEVCKRAAASLSLQWPAAQDAVGQERDLYDGRRLPPQTAHTRQLLPAVPDCMKEVRKHWDSPFRSKLPSRGYTTLEVDNMANLGLGAPPPVETSLAFHLHPNRRSMPATATVALPAKADRLTSSILQRMYKCAGRSVSSLNAVTLLAAYQGNLLEDMGRQIDVDSPDLKLWDEICVVNDLLLRTARGAVQASGRTMGLAIAGERALWLNLSGLGDAQKAEVMDAPYDPTKGLFGPALTKMREASSQRKQEDEAFSLCLPRKPTPRPQPPQPAYATPGRGRAQMGRGQRPPPKAQGSQSRGRSPNPGQWPKPSFAAAASRNRHQPAQNKGQKP